MIFDLFCGLFSQSRAASALDAEYARCRARLRRAGLSEAALRRMDPDERVAVLERAKLDPYDYIYLAC